MCQVFYIDFRSFHAIILQRFREIAEYIARSSNGRTEAFGAFNLGSIPSLAAKSQYHSQELTFYYLLKLQTILTAKQRIAFVNNGDKVILMSKFNEKIAIRHILEVRLKKRVFSFLDFKGRLVDFLLEKFSGDKIRVSNNGSRIDIASGEDVFYFVSVENFGLQVDGATNFDSFKETINRLFDALEEFKDYDIGPITRIGTKSVILYGPSHMSPKSVQDTYKEKFLQHSEKLHDYTGGEISDIAVVFDLKKDGGIANVTTGPVTKEEAMMKFFDNKSTAYQKFDRNHGFLFSFDFGKNDEQNYNFDELRKACLAGVDSVENLFSGFKNYILEQ